MLATISRRGWPVEGGSEWTATAGGLAGHKNVHKKRGLMGGGGTHNRYCAACVVLGAKQSQQIHPLPNQNGFTMLPLSPFYYGQRRSGMQATPPSPPLKKCPSLKLMVSNETKNGLMPDGASPSGNHAGGNLWTTYSGHWLSVWDGWEDDTGGRELMNCASEC